MLHYRQGALVRLRPGDSDRDVATARVIARPKAAQWRRVATEHDGWLEQSKPLPDDTTIAAA